MVKLNLVLKFKKRQFTDNEVKVKVLPVKKNVPLILDDRHLNIVLYSSTTKIAYFMNSSLGSTKHFNINNSSESFVTFLILAYEPSIFL